MGKRVFKLLTTLFFFCQVATSIFSSAQTQGHGHSGSGCAEGMCRIAESESDDVDSLARETNLFITESSGASDGETLKLAQLLFSRIVNQAEDISDHTPLVSPEVARLNNLEDKLFDIGRGIATRGRLVNSVAWTELVAANVCRIYFSGRVDDALAMFEAQEMLLAHDEKGFNEAQANMLEVYPQCFRTEGTPLTWDAVVYVNLIEARAKLGDFSGARSLLRNLNPDFARVGRLDILKGMARGTPTQSDLDWAASLASDEIQSWKSERWLVESRSIPLENVETWLASDSSQNSYRRNLAIERLAEGGQYERAELIAAGSEDVHVRSHGAFMLIDANAVTSAEKLISTGITPYAAVSVQIALARAQPSQQESLLQQAAGDLSKVEPLSNRVELASDILCTAKTVGARTYVQSIASEYARMPAMEQNSRPSDQNRQLLGYCLVKIGMLQQGMSLIDQITDKSVRLSSMETIAMTLAHDWSDPHEAKALLAKAQDIFSSLTIRSQAIAAPEFFRTTAQVDGLNEAISRTKTLTKPDIAKNRLPGHIEQDPYSAALRGLAIAGVELGEVGNTTSFLAESRSIAGDIATRQAAMKALDRAAFLIAEGKKIDTAPLINLVDSLGFEDANDVLLVPYLITLSKLGRLDQAVSLVERFARANVRSFAYANLARSAASSADLRAQAPDLADRALKYAIKTPWREKRIAELAHVAVITVVVERAGAAKAASDRASLEMNGPTSMDRKINDAYDKLKEIVKLDSNEDDQLSFVFALERFGRYFKDRGYQDKTNEVVELLRPFESLAWVSSEAQNAIVGLRK